MEIENMKLIRLIHMMGRSIRYRETINKTVHCEP